GGFARACLRGVHGDHAQLHIADDLDEALDERVTHPRSLLENAAGKTPEDVLGEGGPRTCERPRQPSAWSTRARKARPGTRTRGIAASPRPGGQIGERTLTPSYGGCQVLLPSAFSALDHRTRSRGEPSTAWGAGCENARSVGLLLRGERDLLFLRIDRHG